MKKILIFAALLFSGGAFSQAPRTLNAISRMPYEANDYLILDQQKNPNVVNWVVTISRRSVNTQNSTVEFIREKSFNLIGESFIKLEEAFLTDPYFITVQGLNSSRVIIVEEGPLAINGEPSTMEGTWGCLGSTYAYKINNWVNPNNGSGTLMMDIQNKPDGTPYYEWMSSSTYQYYNQLLANSPQCVDFVKYHDLQQGQSISISTQYNTGNIIKLQNIQPGDGYADASGQAVYGTIYGVQKRLGPWANQNSFGGIMANHLLGQSASGQTFEWARNTLNANNANNANNVPDLTCNGTTFSPTGIGEGGNDAEPIGETVLEFDPCIILSMEYFEENGNPAWLFEYEGDCNLGMNSNGTNGWNWPTSAHAITFQLTSEGNEPITYTYDSFFNENGEYIGAPITLGKGLYTMTIQFADNTYKVYYFESKDKTTSTLTDADFLNVNIFAVPVVGNSFNMTLNSTAKSDFIYELFDDNGNRLYSQNYRMEKDHAFTDLISVPQGIPTGILINKFKFTDGSEITIQTIK